MKHRLAISLLPLGVFACGAVGTPEQAARAAVQPQSPIAASSLRAAVNDDDVRRFYEARDWQPVWNRARKEALTAALREAPRHGLLPSRFLGAFKAAKTPAEQEAAMTRAALDYARALAVGVTDPTQLWDIYTLARPSFEAPAALGKAVAGGDLTGWFGGLAPQTATYRALSQAFVDARRRSEEERGATIADGDLIRQGDRDPRVPEVAQALARGGYRDGGETAAGNTYTPALADAVRTLQRDRGLGDDGVIGPKTLAALNKGAADRARQLAVNLERLRWADRTPSPTRIDVNTAAAELTFWREGAAIDRRTVAVGQPGWETPRLGSPIYRLVANPNWTVPKSIEREELAGLSSSALAARNMVRRGGWIVQQPGPDNALGQVKFDMVNDHAIYLHDTPGKAVFDRPDRHVSHGCVRVADALGLARMIAGQAGRGEAFETAFASGEETFVDLDQRIPVRLLYRTAFVAGDGAVRLVADAYGWDDRLAKAMNLGSSGWGAKATHASDIGP